MNLSTPGAALLAAAVSVSAVPLILLLSRRFHILIDSPGERSSHALPKVRGGGLAILIGLAAGLGGAVLLGRRLDSGEAVLLAGTCVLAGVGLADDLRGLPAWPRLAVQFVCAATVAAALGPIDRLPLPAPANLPLGPLATPFTVLWLVGFTNFFNFMDGLDGLAGGQLIASCVGVAVAAWSAEASALASVLAASTAGFLVYNWWPSRVFLGDVGSMPLGFLLAALPLLAPGGRRSDALFALAVGLTLFLLDPVETLVRRFRRGQPVGKSHRDHAYQGLLVRGDSHGPVSGALVATGLALALAGAAAYRWPALGWPVAMAGGAAYFLERRAAARSRALRES